MKKIITLICLAMLMSVCLVGCGKKEEEEKTDVTYSLTSDWVLSEFTVNGETTTADSLDAEARSLAPSFRSDDGETCIFSNNGVKHNGTISGDYGLYLITFDDTEEHLEAKISGDTMSLINDAGTVYIVFKAMGE